jgi:hypothetical protein
MDRAVGRDDRRVVLVADQVGELVAVEVDGLRLVRAAAEGRADLRLLVAGDARGDERVGDLEEEGASPAEEDDRLTVDAPRDARRPVEAPAVPFGPPGSPPARCPRGNPMLPCSLSC